MNYAEEIFNIAEASDLFIQSVSFGEDSIQFDIVDRARQTEGVLEQTTKVVIVNNNDLLDFYTLVQETGRLILTDVIRKQDDERLRGN